MFNKIFKNTHSKYNKIFNFIFFLRYLLAIFFVSIALFLIIPSFFNYEKKAEIIKKSLLYNYDLKINKYDKIKFKAFPTPRLEFNNVLINFENSDAELNIENLRVFPKILSVYNYKNFEINKIILKNNFISFITLF